MNDSYEQRKDQQALETREERYQITFKDQVLAPLEKNQIMKDKEKLQCQSFLAIDGE